MTWLYSYFYMLVLVFSASVFGAVVNENSSTDQVIPAMTASTYFIDQTLYSQSPRVLANSEEHQYITQQELIYFDGKQSNHHVWGIYRPEVEFQHDNQSILVLRFLAIGELVESSGNISILHISKQQQEVRKGDCLLPLNVATAIEWRNFPRNIAVRVQGE
ncbi:hypothetical protein [Vibrio ziniensis]|uniref:Uncharacterized protein n=1 Tax=Vibrio ziniensis TaxID=2711221 RepID=A0A6G7CED8_9VIBR|nr:hypothetical protein [Vibrio ziniensis]QIH40501.1 hypothetical protein G5S32_00185 [Vibrio ziniensis]